MILYYTPGACSQASHIALVEAGLPYKLVKVGRDKQTDDGRDFEIINSKGYTPALELDDAMILTESAAILTYIAEKSGKLIAKDGLDRWRTLEAIAFMTSEIHGNFRPFFDSSAATAEKDKANKQLIKHFATIEEQLGDKTFLIGNQMTIADTYMFVMLAWATMKGIALPERLSAYSTRMKSRPSITQALAEEGLMEAER